MEKRWQSLLLELVVIWPIPIVGNVIWALFARLMKLFETLHDFLDQSQPTAAPTAGANALLDATLPDNWSAYRTSESSSSMDETDILIEIELPTVSPGQLVTTDIAIPILLPDCLDSLEAIPSQFLQEHYEIQIDDDSSSQTLDICLVGPNGQVLCHTQPGAQPLFQPWTRLALPTGSAR